MNAIGESAGHEDGAHGTDADAELPSVLDDILAEPDIGLLTPEDTRAAMIYDDSEPPPWQPLRLPQAVDLPGKAPSRSLAPGTSSGTSTSAQKASSNPAAASSLRKDSSAGSMGGEPTQEPGSSAAEQRGPGAPQRTRRNGAVRKSEALTREPESLARASSSGATQAARSQGGDFFRLLDSQVGVCAHSHNMSPDVLAQQFSLKGRQVKAISVC